MSERQIARIARTECARLGRTRHRQLRLLLQRFTYRSLFMIAVIRFTIATTFAAPAPNFALRLAARMVQALGTAIVLSLLMTLILRLVSVRRRGPVMGLNSVVIGVAPAVGPTVSDAIVHAWGCHYIFAMMLPMVLPLLARGVIFFKVPASVQKTGVDTCSVFLSAQALGLLFMAFRASSMSRGARQ